MVGPVRAGAGQPADRAARGRRGARAPGRADHLHRRRGRTTAPTHARSARCGGGWWAPTTRPRPASASSRLWDADALVEVQGVALLTGQSSADRAHVLRGRRRPAARESRPNVAGRRAAVPAGGQQLRRQAGVGVGQPSPVGHQPDVVGEGRAPVRGRRRPDQPVRTGACRSRNSAYRAVQRVEVPPAARRGRAARRTPGGRRGTARRSRPARSRRSTSAASSGQVPGRHPHARAPRCRTRAGPAGSAACAASPAPTPAPRRPPAASRRRRGPPPAEDPGVAVGQDVVGGRGERVPGRRRRARRASSSPRRLSREIDERTAGSLDPEPGQQPDQRGDRQPAPAVAGVEPVQRDDELPGLAPARVGRLLDGGHATHDNRCLMRRLLDSRHGSGILGVGAGGAAHAAAPAAPIVDTFCRDHLPPPDQWPSCGSTCPSCATASGSTRGRAAGRAVALGRPPVRARVRDRLELRRAARTRPPGGRRARAGPRPGPRQPGAAARAERAVAGRLLARGAPGRRRRGGHHADAARAASSRRSPSWLGPAWRCATTPGPTSCPEPAHLSPTPTRPS